MAEFTAKMPKTFWECVGAIVIWPLMIVGLAFGLAAMLLGFALAIVAVPVFAVAFVVLGIPVALVFKGVDRILG